MDTNSTTRISQYTRTLIAVKARQLVGRYGFTRSDRTDLEQQLTLAVLEAENAWDATRAGRNTFNNLIVNRKIATIIRHRMRQCRDYRREEISLDESIPGCDGMQVTRAATFADDSDRRRDGLAPSQKHIDLAIDIRSAVGALTPEQQHLCELLSEGSATEAALSLGVSKPTIAKWVRLIREQFAQQGLEEYLQLRADGSVGGGVCDQ